MGAEWAGGRRACGRALTHLEFDSIDAMSTVVTMTMTRIENFSTPSELWLNASKSSSRFSFPSVDTLIEERPGRTGGVGWWVRCVGGWLGGGGSLGALVVLVVLVGLTLIDPWHTT